MYLKPAYHKLLSLAGQSIASYRDVSQKNWTIAPAETQQVESAVYCPRDLERVTSAWNTTDLKYEMGLLEPATREHAAVIAYQLKDVDVVDGHLYCGRWKDKLVPTKARIMRPAIEDRQASGTLATTYSGGHYFGHWLTDDLTLNLAAQEIGNAFSLERTPFIHEAGYRDLLDIPKKAVTATHFDEVVILQDFGQGKHKRKRYDKLRARLRAKMPGAGGKRVLLRRGNTGVSRAIVNSDEFENYLSSVGFTIVDQENLSPAEIARQTMGAEVAIGVEGSQIPHALLSMAEGGVLCCIQPPYRFNNTIKGYTDCLDMHYSILVGHLAPGGFRIEVDDLKAVLEKIDAALETRILRR